MRKLENIANLPILFLKHPTSLRHMFSWLRSLFNAGAQNELPWIAFDAVLWLKSYLQPHMNVFEYGSGGSTIFFLKRVKKIISIEHAQTWFEQVDARLKKQGALNYEYFLIKPQQSGTAQVPYSYTSYTSTSADVENLNFEQYVKSIEKYPDKYFELVFIDGRARASCIYHAVKKIRWGGYLLLDNSDRQEYQETISLLLKDCARRDFSGITCASIYFSKTSIWKII